MDRLASAADALGYDLVRRVPPQQAHDAMLAKRRAEDGPAMVGADDRPAVTSAPGFDGRMVPRVPHDNRPLTVSTCDRAADDFSNIGGGRV